jgi:hypothetical protein
MTKLKNTKKKKKKKNKQGIKQGIIVKPRLIIKYPRKYPKKVPITKLVKMPIINSKKSSKYSPRSCQKLSKKTITLASNFAKKSNFDTREFFKVGDVIRAQWTIKNKTIWWRAKVIKAKNIAIGFSKICRRYVLKYDPERFYPRGKIMEHCFIDECRLFDITEAQLVSYYIESTDSAE